MIRYANGMPANEIESSGLWQKAQASQGIGACVELRKLDDGQVGMRNSRFPAGPALVLTGEETRAFFVGVKNGEFDHLLS
ncbi:DUF397 domain-containing protein [Kitasatospora cineracea]